MERSDILERVKKLLALSKSNNLNEAEVALEKAQELSYVKADAEGIAESGSLDQVVLHLKEAMALAITGFETLMEKLRATTTNAFARGTDLEKLVQAMAKKHMPMSDLEAASVTHWLRDEDPTAFGMIQALTRHAQDAKTYQRATDFETFGGMILDFSPRQWNELQEMAKAA